MSQQPLPKHNNSVHFSSLLKEASRSNGDHGDEGDTHGDAALPPTRTASVQRVHRPMGAVVAMNHGAPRPFFAKSYGYGVTQHFTTSTNASEPKSKLEEEEEKTQQQQPKETVAFLDRVVEQLNGSIKKHPAETLAVLFASDIGSIGAMYGVLTLTGIEFSPEFALAFAASRPFRRFRLPLDLAAAAAVSKAFPAFSRVRLSDLAGALPNRPIPEAGVSSSTPAFLVKAMEKAKDVIDNYGAAYMMGSRLAGVGVVCGLYFLIKQGVDVMPLLAKLGVEEVGTALGSYAAAVVFSSAFYPVTLGVTGYVVPFVAKARRTILP